MLIPWGSAPWLEDDELSYGDPPLWRPRGEAGPIFIVVEMDLYRPASAVVTATEEWLAAPWMALAQDAEQIETSERLYASDLGYRSRWQDAVGVRVYPPTVADGMASDTGVSLAPSRPAAGASWGTLRLLNTDGRYDALIQGGRNPDGRAVRIRMGRKLRDSARGLWRDPPFPQLAPLWSGLARNWFVTEQALEIPLRDASYWLERPWQGSLYAGTGGLEGGDDLKGSPKPRARGGTASFPIPNVAPALVDPAALIYQYSDAPGTVVTVYERGKAVFTPGANVADLYVGTTSPGTYRTCNALGLFQLGSTPVGEITADVTGQFAVAGAISTAASLARWIMLEDLAVPAEYVDSAGLAGLDVAYPYTAGIWTGAQEADGAEQLGKVVASMGAKLLPGRNGALRAVPLRWPPPSASAIYTADQIVALVPRQMPEGLDPPPYRLRVGWGQNYTQQRVDIESSVTAARRAFLSEEWRYAAWSSGSVLLAYRRPSDPAPMETALLQSVHAQAVVDALGALWGTRRRLFDLVLPIHLAVLHQEGDGLIVSYPMDDLEGGKPVLIVGQSLRTGEATATFKVLI